MTRIAVLDYGMGNRRSVCKALEHVGAVVSLTGEPTRIADADGLVVPGVGAFPAAMARLHERGLVDPIREAVGGGLPLLGICLGMQLLFDRSTELGETDGLRLIRGQVTRLAAGGRRIPHIGWNEVTFERPSPLSVGLPAAGTAFYHVHSFVARPADPSDVLGSCEYGERFATIVGSGNVLGTQFHPEKSSTHGLAMLAGFVALCGGDPRRSWAATAATRG